MDIQFFSQQADAHADILFIGFDGQAFMGSDPYIKDKLKERLEQTVKSVQFDGKWGHHLDILGDDQHAQITILGLNIDKMNKKAIGQKELLFLGGVIAKKARKRKSVKVMLPEVVCESIGGDSVEALIAQGIQIADWRFLKYKSDITKEQSHIKKVYIQTADIQKAKQDYIYLKAAADGMQAARELVSEPGNNLYPETFMEHSLALRQLGCEVEVLDVTQLQDKKMGGILSVGQGSIHKPYMVIIRWKGGSADQKPIAFVGKGVTFDTGGISLKPASGMEEMIFDMGGAAAAFGAIKSLALRKAKMNVTAILGLAENMPDGQAMRPGDIISTYSGKTVEVINTDAEGRLVLADCLTYAQKDEKAGTVVDLATLTGAMLVALGTQRAGIFSNSDPLLEGLTTAGGKVGELLWPFPLGEEYDGQITSHHADIRNMGKTRWGGAISAAKFLAYFIEDQTQWAHIDMAPTAWNNEEKLPLCVGATGYGVRLLDAFIKSLEIKENKSE